MIDAREGAVQLCAFFVGDTEYVVDLARVEELLPAQGTTPLPDAPGWIDGVTNLHGAIVPVVNLGRRLGATGSPPPGLRPKWIVARVGRRRFALAVDGVVGILRVRRADLQPLSATTPAEPFVIGTTGEANGRKRLLDVKAVLRSGLP